MVCQYIENTPFGVGAITSGGKNPGKAGKLFVCFEFQNVENSRKLEKNQEIQIKRIKSIKSKRILITFYSNKSKSPMLNANVNTITFPRNSMLH